MTTVDMSNSLFVQIFEFFAKEIIGDILYFPIWWYSKGLERRLVGFVDMVKQANQEFSLTIWVKNLFVPMYGQNDWQGRIVSFFMRLAQIIGRLIMVGLWAIVGLALVALWIAAPIAIVWQLFINL
jgi:hypothetical protein